MSDYLRFFILLIAGWINRDQQKIIDYLTEEIRVYQDLCKAINSDSMISKGTD